MQKTQNTDRIAIIGMAGRFPGARNINEFWRNLRDGAESISYFTDDELLSAGIAPALLGNPDYVKAKGVLEGAELFDAAFFGFNPREAEITDPQQRIFLEAAWEALERAGYDPQKYEGAIGVYAGASVNSYLLINLASNQDLIESIGLLQTFIHNRNDHLSTQTSYKLNLRGPSVTVQTACSTSLVAVHIACQSLLNGECDMALAGGVSIRLPQQSGYLYQEGSIVSPDGHCRPFDADARGAVDGNGVGIVVLKRLEDAIADGDSIHAVIGGSAVNNDGSLKIGYTAPSVDGQAEVIVEAQSMAGVEPETITYVETHGTGTTLGDPIEMEALTQAFRSSTDKKQFCAVGSVKSNIGHLDTAAGVAGLIKTVLALKHKQIPPSLHFQKPNPRIDFPNSPFFVNTTLRDWRSPLGPHRAAVSSFGIGGTNAHLILEEAPADEPSDNCRPCKLLTISAKTPSALEKASANLAAYLKENAETELADAAYTLQVGRREFDHRRIVVSRSREQAVEGLERMDPRRVHTGLDAPRDRVVVYMFSGQGSQYVNMGRELYESEKVYRKYVDECAEELKVELGMDIREVIYPERGKEEEAGERLNETMLTQPALFVVEYSMAKMWEWWGIEAGEMTGHSIGEFVAASLAGVFSMEEGLRLVAARGKLMQEMREGGMLVVQKGEEEVKKYLREGLWIGAVNGPGLVVVSGEKEEIEKLEGELVRDGVVTRRLKTRRGFHSGMMEEAAKKFVEEVKKVNLKEPKVRYTSNVSGKWIRNEEAIDAVYWGRQMREAVRFGEGLEEINKEKDRILLEVGPGRGLATIARWLPKKPAGQIILNSLPREEEREEELEQVKWTLGRLWAVGKEVKWGNYYEGEKRKRVELPSYPFERQKYWIEPKREGMRVAGEKAHRKKNDVAQWFYVPLWKQTVLRDYSVNGGRTKQSWLVFEDGNGLGKALLNRLAEESQQAVRVVKGSLFERLSDGAYMVNHRRREDYSRLIKELRASGKFPEKIIHLWGVTEGEAHPGRGWQEKVLEDGFYSLLYLAQALGEENTDEGLEIAVITNDMQPVIGERTLQPEKATVLGPCKVIPQEYPNLKCRSIDVTIGEGEERELAEQIVGEIRRGFPDAVAYRGGRRWVQWFEPAPLERAAADKNRLISGGVYLITGGLGGVGLELAKYLAQAARARLILCGRSQFPDRPSWERHLAAHPGNEVSKKIQKLMEIERMGAEVMIARADVANEEEVRALVARAKRRFGRINGVIHAAGVAGGGMIQIKTREMAAGVLAPKMEGLRALESALKGEELDFLVLCSSRSSVIGGFGQVDYCAANAFLDAFAHYNRSTNGAFTVSINWDAWQDVGMVVNAAARTGASQAERTGHPLLGKLSSDTADGQVYSVEFSVADHWALDDHRIVGSAVVPGTAYLEMARAAAEKFALGRQIEIRDAFFLAPLAVRDDEKRETRIVVEKDEDGFRYTVSSKTISDDGDGANWQEHSIGNIGFVDPEPPERHDIKQIIARCDAREEIITDESERDPDLGPRWDSLQRVYVGDDELLAILELSEEFSADFETLKLHPALLDRGTGTAKHYLASDGYYLPMSYHRLRVKAPLPRKIYVYVKQRDKYSKKETISFDFVIMDENGLECVDIQGFSQKRVNDVAGQIKALAGTERRKPESPQAINVSGEEKKPKNIYERSLIEGISPQEGAEAFSRILCNNAPAQVVVSTKDLQTSIEQAKAFTQKRVSEEIENFQITKAAHPRPDIQTSYVAPATEMEQTLAAIWQEILGIETAGVHDNFFELGGDSVQAIQIVAKANQAGIRLSPQQLFQYQTISELAAASQTDRVVEAEQGIVTGLVPLTPTQRQFLERELPDPNHFNQTVLLDAKQPLDGSTLSEALKRVLEHHDALRLRIERTESGWRQFNAALQADAPLTLKDLSGLSEGEQSSAIEKISARLQASLNLAHGPIIRMALFNLGRGKPGKLLVGVHHLAIDGMSWRILLEDLQTAYQQVSSGKEITLPRKTTSFRAWAQRLESHSQSEAISKEVDYWLSALSRRTAPLPVDREDGLEANDEASARVFSQSLSVEQTGALLHDVARAFHTQTEEALLAALAQAFSDWTQTGALLVDLESTARDGLFEDLDLSRTVGPFVSMYPVLLEISQAQNPGDVVKSVKQELRRIPGRGVGYGMLRHMSGASGHAEKMLDIARAQVKFNYLGQFDQLLSGSGLFSPAIESTGPPRALCGRRSHLIEVNSFMIGGQLHLEWTYSEKLHRRDTIGRVAKRFAEAIESIIAQARRGESVEFIPSDFPLAALDEDKLSDISLLIEESDQLVEESPDYR
jgi:phthiocerol/phenolphthiocerol synthesis type-I polyketide synthase E